MTSPAPNPPPTKPGLGDRLKLLFEEYGWIAINTYLVLSLVVFAGFFVAIKLGLSIESSAGAATTAGAAWVGLKLTQPIRIPVALGLTPLVARIWWRSRGRRPRPPASANG